MANPEHIEIAKAGPAAIADWRKEHPYDPLELSDADLSGTDFTGANLMWSRLAGANLIDSTLVDTNLTQADLTNSRLNGVDFSRADLKLSNLRFAKLRSANLTGASLVQTELTNADLNRANLESADLSLSNITGGDLSNTNLWQTDLNGADLREANLRFAQLIETNLRRTNLERANLFGAVVSRAYLEDANFDQAVSGATNWLDLDFSTVKKLNTVRHKGASAISIGSLYRSDGNVAPEFLRGCGLPESFVTALPELPSVSLQFDSCFITHNHKDEEVAKRLYEELSKRGIRCWLDQQPIDMRVETRSDRGIRLWDKLVFFASKDSLKHASAASEIDEAFANEERLMKERGMKTETFIPIDLDGFIASDDFSHSRQEEIKSRTSINVAGWQNDGQILNSGFSRVIQLLSFDGTEVSSVEGGVKTDPGIRASTISESMDSNLQGTTADEEIAESVSEDPSNSKVSDSEFRSTEDAVAVADSNTDSDPGDSLGISQDLDLEETDELVEQLNRDTEHDTEPVLDDPLSRISELVGTGDELLSGFSRLISNDGGNSLWYNYKGKKVLNHHLRQRNAESTMIWEAEKLPIDGLGGYSYFVFSGSFGAHEGVQTDGFQFLVNGEERLAFDLAREEKTWHTSDKTVVVMYSPRWMSKHDTAGFFYIAVANAQFEPGDTIQFGVRSKGGGSNRWFGLFPSTDPVRLQSEDASSASR